MKELMWSFSKFTLWVLSGTLILFYTFWGCQRESEHISKKAPLDESKGKDWPGWRGPNMNGRATETGIFEASRNYSLKLVWKRPLGSGYSGVSIADSLGVTMFSEGTFDLTIAFDPKNGEELWQFRIDSTHFGRNGSQNGPRSTPLIYKGKVFCLGPKGQLFALDAKTGQKLWLTSLPKEHGSLEPLYGYTTSPIAYNDILIVQTGGKNGNAFTGFDINTGHSLWTTGNDIIMYQSPMIYSVNGSDQVLCVGNRILYGLRPESGDMHWQYQYGGDSFPVGSASMNPVLIDKNRIFLKNKRTGSVLIDLAPEGKNFTPREVWKSKNIKLTYVVTVYHHGYLFGYSGRFLTCLDINTGKSVWKSRKPGDGFPIVLDGHLVIITKKGTLSIAPASPEGFNEIASLKLFDQLVWTAPSFANGKIYLRSLSEIACVEITEPGPVVVRTDSIHEGVLAGSNFAQFVARVAETDNKSAMIDEFMSSQKQFPVIEGDNMVHFISRDKATDMAIVGDITGYRVEQPMNRIEGTDLFYYSTYLEPDARVFYRFTKDFEENITDALNPKKTMHPLFGESSYLEMSKWVKPLHLEEDPNVVRGRIDSLVFQSTRIDGRQMLKIYLPAEYEESKTSYPVVYVHGTIGQSKIPTTLNNVIGKSVAPVIVVFITPIFRGRYGEYVGNFRDTYAQIFVEEIVASIDGKYRTIPSSEFRANIGVYYGGFMALYATFRYPGMFGKLGLQSPYWDSGEEQKHSPLLSRADRQELMIYLDWGKYDMRGPLEGYDFRQGSRSLARLLRANGYDFTGGEVNEGHGWVSWRNRNDRVFEALFPLDQ